MPKTITWIKRWFTPLLLTLIAIVLMFVFSYLDRPNAVATTVLVSAIASFLGVALTMGITQLQLDKQSENDRNQAFESEKFKERLLSYQKFLDALCEYVETQSDKSKAILRFRTAALAMHVSDEQIVKTNKSVGNLISMYEGPDSEDDKLLQNLFEISDTFRISLYPEMPTEHISEYNPSIQSLAKTLHNATDASDKNEQMLEDEEERAEINSTPDEESWDEIVRATAAKGWSVSASESTDSIKVNSDDSTVSIQFRKPRSGTYYVVEILAGDDTELTKVAKAVFKGARSGGKWWRELTSLNNYGVKKGHNLVASLQTNAKARAVVAKWIEKLTDFLSSN